MKYTKSEVDVVLGAVKDRVYDLAENHLGLKYNQTMEQHIALQNEWLMLRQHYYAICDEECRTRPVDEVVDDILALSRTVQNALVVYRARNTGMSEQFIEGMLNVGGGPT